MTALDVRCPTCGAPKGAPCRSVHRQNPCRKPHRQRETRAHLISTGKQVAKRQRRRVRTMPADVRDAVLARAGGQCEARDLWPTVACSGRLHLHHVLPRSAGGQNTVDNLRAHGDQHHMTTHSWPTHARELGLLRSRYSRRVA